MVNLKPEGGGNQELRILCPLPVVIMWAGADCSNPPHHTGSIITANVGDCRAVLSRRGHAIDLTDDHKPNKPREIKVSEGGGCLVLLHCKT